MKQLKEYYNNEFGTIRTATINDEPYFVGKDVADVLGYQNPQKAVRDHVDDEDKTLNESFTVNGTMITLINESGLYSLILSSKLPNAKRFKKWVTSEVLPSIRKHGGYIAGQNQMNEEELMARAILFARDKIEEQKKVIAELEPKAFFADAVSSSNDSILVRELAKMMRQNGLNIGEKRLYAKLREDGFIIQKSCEPTQKAMEMGLFEIIIRTIDTGRTDRYPLELRTTKVTGKGQIYFINRYCKDYKKNVTATQIYETLIRSWAYSKGAEAKNIRITEIKKDLTYKCAIKKTISNTFYAH